MQSWLGLHIPTLNHWYKNPDDSRYMSLIKSSTGSYWMGNHIRSSITGWETTRPLLFKGIRYPIIVKGVPAPCFLFVCFLLLLGSVHKYFGGGGWAIENFCRQTFLTPPSQAAKTFWTPLNKWKNFFDPPPHCYMHNIRVFPQHQFIWYTPQVYQYYW